VTGTIVICIGNPFRRDDGVAAAVAVRARHALPPAVRVVELDGEPARVVEAWAGAELAIVVDAARSGARAGAIRRIEVATGEKGAGRGLPASRPASSHGYALGDALELGRALGRVPARLVAFAVEGGDFADGPGLSDAVARAVPDVAARVVEEAVTSPAPVPMPGAG
jgi:hydrogenase maturation protease